MLRILHTTKLLATISLVGLGGCNDVTTDDSSEFRELESIAYAAESEAAGWNVSIEMLSLSGDMICKKAEEGSVFTSEGPAPKVQLYIDGILKETRDYDAGDEYIAFETRATDSDLNLADGNHTAYCTALPDMPFPVDGGEWILCNTKEGTSKVCTKSGVLDFTIQTLDEPLDEVAADATELLQVGDCGNGNGNGNRSSSNLCTGWANLQKGDYIFRFTCASEERWSIDLATKRPSSSPHNLSVLTSLQVFDPSGSRGVAGSSGSNDTLTFDVASSGNCIASVKLFDDARIKLHMIRKKSSDESERCWDYKLPTRHIAQENEWSCGVQNVRMWLQEAYNMNLSQDDVAAYTEPSDPEAQKTGTNMIEMNDALSSLTDKGYWRVGYGDKHYAAKDVARNLESLAEPVAIVGTFPRGDLALSDGCRGMHFFLARGYRACVKGPDAPENADESFGDARIVGFYLEDSVYRSKYYKDRGLDQWATPRNLTPVEDIFDYRWETTGCKHTGACGYFSFLGWFSNCASRYWSVQRSPNITFDGYEVLDDNAVPSY